MKFTSIKIDNFLTIGKASVRLADRGLVLIQGVNDADTSAKSNGAGKSSIADALSWALYGATARGEDGDKVVNRKAGKNCAVTVDIEDGDDVFRVTRYRKHKQGKNTLNLEHIAADGTISELTKGTTALTQAEIVKIVGATHDVFCGAIYAGQEAMPDLPGMTDKHLKMLVEEAAGVTVLEDAYREANTRALAAKGELAGIIGTLNAERTKFSDTEERIEDLVDRRDRHEVDRADKIEELKTELGTAVKRAKNIKAAVDAFDKPALEQGVADCDAKIAAVRDERDEEIRLERGESQAQATVSRASANLDNAVASAKRTKKRYEELDHQVGCPCSSCARPFTAEDIAPAKTSTKTEYNDLVAKARERKTELEDAQKALTSAQSALDAHRASMTDLAQVTRERASLIDQLNQLAGRTSEHQTALREVKRLKDAVEKAAADPNPYAEMIDAAEKQKAAIAAKIETLEEREEEATRKLRVASMTAKVFSPAGVRAHILDDVTPFLNAQTAKYLGTLSDGNITAEWSTLVPNAKGELREKFSITVTSATGGDSFKSISGGEKRKVRIATALALQDLVARRATKPIELFVGDEIDDALDSAGLERLMAILEEKARERGSVFIISHSDLKDWVSTMMIVRKGAGGVSSVEELTT